MLLITIAKKDGCGLVQRGFVRLSGDFADQLRNQVARQGGHQFPVQDDGPCIRDGKMRGTLYSVQLMQVIGQHALPMQGLRQRLQGFDLVIDPGQQDRLVEQGRPDLP